MKQPAKPMASKQKGRWTPILLMLAAASQTLHSCSDDDTYYPSLTKDMAMVTSDTQGRLTTVTTDNGSTYNISPQGAHINAADTTIRCLATYTLQENEMTLYAISPIFCQKAYRPEEITAIKDSTEAPGTEHLPRDPVKVISIWQSPSFINLHLGVKTTDNGTSQYAFCNDSASHYSLVHRRPPKDNESYTKHVYLSMPVPTGTDSLTFSVYTYKGWIDRTFKWLGGGK